MTAFVDLALVDEDTSDDEISYDPTDDVMLSGSDDEVSSSDDETSEDGNDGLVEEVREELEEMKRAKNAKRLARSLQRKGESRIIEDFWTLGYAGLPSVSRSPSTWRSEARGQGANDSACEVREHLGRIFSNW